MPAPTSRRARDKARAWAAASQQDFDISFSNTLNEWCRTISYHPIDKPLPFEPYQRLADILQYCSSARRSQAEPVGRARLDAAFRKAEPWRRADFESRAAADGGPSTCGAARIYEGSPQTFQTAQRRMKHAAEQIREMAGPNGLIALQVRRARMDAAAALRLAFSVANGKPPLVR